MSPLIKKANRWASSLYGDQNTEESVPARVMVAGATLTAVFSLVSQSDISLPARPLIPVAALAGSYVSWRLRNRKRVLYKLILSMVLLVVAFVFIESALGRKQDLRIALANLFLWVLVIHSFDLPEKKDLYVSLAASLILISFASSFSTSNSFFLYIAAFVFFSICAMLLLSESGLSSIASKSGKKHLSKALFKTTAAILIILSVALPASAFIPRFGGFVPKTKLFSNIILSSVGFSGGLMSPSIQIYGGELPDIPFAHNPDAYHGALDALDLRVRGSLSDKLLFKVKASFPAYWKAVTFTDFEGRGWVKDPDEERVELQAQPAPADLGSKERLSGFYTKELFQTFIIETDLPNLLMASNTPRLLYVPSTYVYVEPSSLEVYLPSILTKGMSYSVVSSYNSTSEDVLAAAAFPGEGVVPEEYLSLENVSPDVRVLAKEIVGNETSPYMCAKMIKAYLHENCNYKIDFQEIPRNANALDHFLFESREGTCEHFSTAFALMCRSVGIPSRLVAGYSTGEYNPFTNCYEVRAKDGHAWVELYFPTCGWVTFEPTPGAEYPDPFPRTGAFFLLSDVINYMGGVLSAVVPDSWISFFQSVFKESAVAVSAAYSSFSDFFSKHLNVVLGTALLAASMTILMCLKRFRSKRKRTDLEYFSKQFNSFFHKMAKYANIPDASTLTPLEIFESLRSYGFDDRFSDVEDFLSDLVYFYNESVFSQEPLSEKEALFFINRMGSFRIREVF